MKCPRCGFEALRKCKNSLHDMTPENTILLKDARKRAGFVRACRACHNATSRRWERKHRQQRSAYEKRRYATDKIFCLTKILARAERKVRQRERDRGWV